MKKLGKVLPYLLITFLIFLGAVNSTVYAIDLTDDTITTTDDSDSDGN